VRALWDEGEDVCDSVVNDGWKSRKPAEVDFTRLCGDGALRGSSGAEPRHHTVGIVAVHFGVN